MLRNLCLTALVTAAAAILGLGLFGNLAMADDMEHLALVERAANDVVTDAGAEGDSVGDVLTFANEMYDEANETMVGHDNGWCVRTAVAKAWECTFTVTLDGGQISVEGPFLDSGDSMMAVTGGTGDYAKARGEMMLHARDAEGSAYDFVFTLHR
jgi:allene oxide cyclase